MKAGEKHLKMTPSIAKDPVFNITGSPEDDKNYVIVDLVFDTLNEAEQCHAKLLNLWNRVEGSIMNNPQSRIMEVIEDETIY
jgi:hypothetical protein